MSTRSNRLIALGVAGGSLLVLASTIVAAAGTNVTVTVTRIRPGLVTSSPSGIDCGSDCEATPQFGEQMTLTATGTKGAFSRWEGGICGSDTDNVCEFSATTTQEKAIFRRYVNIMYANATDRFSGRVNAADSQCVAGRTVTLLKDGSVVDSLMTDVNGRWVSRPVPEAWMPEVWKARVEATQDCPQGTSGQALFLT